MSCGCCCKKKANKEEGGSPLPSLDTIQQFDDAVAAEVLVVVACYVKWCKNCQQMAPKVEQLAAGYTVSAHFYRMDIEVNSQCAVNLEIHATPTFLFFKDGEEVARIVGSDYEKVKAMVNKHNRRPRRDSRKRSSVVDKQLSKKLVKDNSKIASRPQSPS